MVWLNSTFALLFLLVLLAVPGSLSLSWNEVLRLIFIETGLYFFWTRRMQKTSIFHEDKSHQIYLYVYAITAMFLVTQFDCILQDMQGGYRLFSWGSILVVLVLFVIFFRNCWNAGSETCWQFNTIDKIVLACAIFFLLLIASSRAIWSSEKKILDVVYESLKIVQYVILWFVFTRLFDGKRNDIWSNCLGTVDGKKWLENRLRYLALVIFVFWGGAILYGGYSVKRAYSHTTDGRQYYEKKNYEAAIFSFEKARGINRSLDIQRLRITYLEGLASTFIKLNKFDRLADIHEEFLKHFPKSDVTRRMGRIFYQEGVWNEAIGAFESYLREGGEDAVVLNWLGDCFLKTGALNDLVRMQKTFSHEPVLAPTSREEFEFTGELYFLQEKWEKALASFNKAASLARATPALQYKMGKCLLDLGRIDEAVDLLRRVNGDSIHIADAYYQLGRCFEALGDTERAIYNYRQTLKSLPNHWDSSQSLERLGQRDAVQAYPDRRTSYAFDTSLILVGYAIPQRMYVVGDTIEFDLFWKLDNSWRGDKDQFRAFFHLDAYDTAGETLYRLISHETIFLPPAIQWEWGEVVSQSYRFIIGDLILIKNNNEERFVDPRKEDIRFPDGMVFELNLGLIYHKGSPREYLSKEIIPLANIPVGQAYSDNQR